MSVFGSGENLAHSGAISGDKIDNITVFREQFNGWDLKINDPTIILISDLRKQPLSEWDKTFCKEVHLSQVSFRQITTEELSDIFFYPIQLISRRRMQIGWKALWLHFTDQEKAAIVQIAQSYISSKYKSYTKSQLPHPDTMNWSSKI